MLEQNGSVYRYWGAEHHHGHHGHHLTNTDGSGVTDVEGAKDDAGLAFQCRLHVNLDPQIE
jgi:hypothetical protein